MNKNLKLIVLPMTAVVSTTLFTSCFKRDSGPKDKYEVSISARSLPSEQQVLQLWESEYEKLHPEVDIIVDGWGSNEGTSENYVMKNALNRDMLTNIIYTTDDSTAMLAQKKNFVDLRPYFEASKETDYTKYYNKKITKIIPQITFSGLFFNYSCMMTQKYLDSLNQNINKCN